MRRADARENYGRLLAVAHEVIGEHGADASLREIARRSGVGLATLYRHFPTRDALLDALLQARLDALTHLADHAETTESPDGALLAWFRQAVAFSQTYTGVVTLMADALNDERSALHASCSAMRAAAARLLARAQREGTARTDLDRDDILGIVTALAWLGDQPAFAPRAGHLVEVIGRAVFGAGISEKRSPKNDY